MLNRITRKVDPTKPMIALTFDDGPTLEVTPHILDLFEQYDVVGSFFLNSNKINEETTKIVERAYSMGCDIQNHSVSHPAMSKMTPEELLAETEPVTEAIEQITGEAPKFFRPPYIDVSDTMFETIKLTFICGRGCDDWLPEVSAKERAERILSQAKDGEIILLHDFAENIATYEALKTIVPALLEAGFQLVTVTELFQAKGVAISPDDKNMYSWVG